MINPTLVDQLLVAKKRGLLAEVIQNRPRGYTVEVQILFNETIKRTTIYQIQKYIKSKYGYETYQIKELRPNLPTLLYLNIRMPR